MTITEAEAIFQAAQRAHVKADRLVHAVYLEAPADGHRSELVGHVQDLEEALGFRLVAKFEGEM